MTGENSTQIEVEQGKGTADPLFPLGWAGMCSAMCLRNLKSKADCVYKLMVDEKNECMNYRDRQTNNKFVRTKRKII